MDINQLTHKCMSIIRNIGSGDYGIFVFAAPYVDPLVADSILIYNFNIKLNINVPGSYSTLEFFVCFTASLHHSSYKV